MTVSTIDDVLSILADGREGHKGAMWRAIGILVAAGHAPLVRRCCAVWARHAVLRWFRGPAPYDRILRRSCRMAYRYAFGRADGRDIYVARCQAEMTARDSTGVAVEVARAVARACAFPGMPDSMEADAPPSWFTAAFWDVPWCAARASGAQRTAWIAYHRHLRRAVERLRRSTGS